MWLCSQLVQGCRLENRAPVPRASLIVTNHAKRWQTLGGSPRERTSACWRDLPRLRKPAELPSSLSSWWMVNLISCKLLCCMGSPAATGWPPLEIRIPRFQDLVKGLAIVKHNNLFLNSSRFIIPPTSDGLPIPIFGSWAHRSYFWFSSGAHRLCVLFEQNDIYRPRDPIVQNSY